MEEITPLQPDEPKTITLERSALAYLMETARWCKLMAIAGFVGLGLLVLLGIFYSALISAISGGELDALPVTFSWAIGLVYILFAVLFFFPVMYLYRFSKQTPSSIRSKTTEQLTEALSNLKSLFKFMGIYTAVILVIYGLVFFGFLMTVAFIESAAG
jgi:hypothetical protein